MHEYRRNVNKRNVTTGRDLGGGIAALQFVAKLSGIALRRWVLCPQRARTKRERTAGAITELFNYSTAQTRPDRILLSGRATTGLVLTITNLTGEALCPRKTCHCMCGFPRTPYSVVRRFFPLCKRNLLRSNTARLGHHARAAARRRKGPRGWPPIQRSNPVFSNSSAASQFPRPAV
jgi:hypothetical protein